MRVSVYLQMHTGTWLNGAVRTDELHLVEISVGARASGASTDSMLEAAIRSPDINTTATRACRPVTRPMLLLVGNNADMR